jgi:hypothetical protein
MFAVFCIGSNDSKVFNLSFKEDTVAVDDTRVQAWFVYCWSKPIFTKDDANMCFLQSRGFGMTLHS